MGGGSKDMDKIRKNGAVKIGDTEMYYVSFGKGEKKLVVLPGLSDGLATVKGKSLVLSAPYRRYLNEFTVFMFSRKNEMPEGYSIREMAADLVFAMKQLGIEKASVLGVSQGGMVAQYVAIDHPEIVDKLILTVTAPGVNDMIRGVVGSWIDMAKKDDHVSLMCDTAEKTYSDAYLKKYRKVFPLMAAFTKPKSYDRFYKNAYSILGFDARGDLGKIKSPTLIIAGDDDKIVGNDAAKELKEGIKCSELFVYAGLGHGTFEEAPDFYDRVFTFCK